MGEMGRAPAQEAEGPTGGMPSQIVYIVGNEACERFSFYGMRNILVAFMVSVLLMQKSDAKVVYHLFVALVYLTPLMGGYLADRVLGKYKTILYLSLLYCVGHALLAIGEGTLWGLYSGLLFISLGAGGIKPCVSAHVGDQFDKTNKHLLKKIFNIFYFTINFGSFFATLLIPVLADRLGWAVAFGVPGILMALATFVFWMGRDKFVSVPPSGPNPNSFGRVVGFALARQPLYLGAALGGLLMLSAAVLGFILHGLQLEEKRPEAILEWIALGGLLAMLFAGGVAWLKGMPLVELSENARGRLLAGQPEESRAGVVWLVLLLVLAAVGGVVGLGYGLGTSTLGTGGLAALAVVLQGGLVAALWRLPRGLAGPGEPGGAAPYRAPAATQRRFPEAATEGTRAALRVMKIFFLVLVFWALFDQHGSSWVLQGQQMTQDTLGFRIDPSQFQAMNPALVMLLIPLLGGLVYPWLERRGVSVAPLKRIRVGLFISGLSFVVVAALQLWIDACVEAKTPTPSILWQALPYLLLTVGEVLISITGLEFAYTQAPRAMKSTIMSFWYFTVFLGNLLAAYIEKVQLFGAAGQFGLYAVLMELAALAFLWISRGYQVVEYIEDDRSSAERDEALAAAKPEPA